jgi:hypothetical protein
MPLHVAIATELNRGLLATYLHTPASLSVHAMRLPRRHSTRQSHTEATTAATYVLALAIRGTKVAWPPLGIVPVVSHRDGADLVWPTRPRLA